MTAALAPLSFGRGVIVTGDQPVPEPWRTAVEIVVDETILASPSAALAALHAAWLNRTPIVVRLEVDPALFRQPGSEAVEPWTLPPTFEFPLDRLHFLVWANNYDARSGELVWWWTNKASRLGAAPAPTTDITLAGGDPAWVDAGPRGSVPAVGTAVVHADSVDVGRLSVVPPVGDEEEAAAIELADDQRAAVVHSAGPARVIAPAGSGKTRVLTERLRHLLVARGYEREGVLAVAYNVRARDELVERTAPFRPRVQTLNGMGYEVIADALGSAPRIVEERDLRRIIDRLLPAKRQRRANTDPIAPYLEALGIARLALRDPAVVEAERDDVPGLGELFARYRHALRETAGIDFDEQIYYAVELLLADGDLRRRMQGRYRYLLVDEFQDLTPAHVLLLRLLSAPRLDVFGVGDDDQVIYGHAGASPEFLIDFDQLFPGATNYALGVNHRCPAAVVTAADHLLSWNRRRVAKEITTGPTAAPGDSRLDVREVPTEELTTDLAETVTGWLADGRAPHEIAVLTRVNASLLGPQIALAQAGIPLDSNLGPDILDRLGVRAALAYLRLACSAGALDRDDLVEVYRRPSRGLPEWIVKWFRSGMTLAALEGVAERIDDEKVAIKVVSLATDIGLVTRLVARGKPTREVLAAIRGRVGLGEAMEQLDRSKSEGSSQLDDLEALEQVADLHPDPATFESWLRGLLTRERNRDGVTLASIHRVKGREWPAVVVYGASSGLLPHRLAENVEEERRVLHVGITRGRDEVVVIADANRPSPFLPELTSRAPTPSAEPARLGQSAAPATSATRSGGPKQSKQKASDPGPKGDETNPVFVALRTWRGEEARSQSMPPYVIFHDRTLHEIARLMPVSLRELGLVGGVGPAKLEKYAPAVLGVVAASRHVDHISGDHISGDHISGDSVSGEPIPGDSIPGDGIGATQAVGSDRR